MIEKPPKKSDIATKIMERMVRMPPKQHKDMKLGKPRAKAGPKERSASKGRVHKGKSRA
jgi:hypothetical protein